MANCSDYSFRNITSMEIQVAAIQWFARSSYTLLLKKQCELCLSRADISLDDVDFSCLDEVFVCN